MSFRNLFAVPGALLLSLLLAGGAGRNMHGQTPQECGSVSGVVKIATQALSPAPFPVTKDEKYCGRKKSSPRLVVGRGGGVQSAVVYLESVRQEERSDRSSPAMLEQKGCEYVPHILFVPVGGELTIVNSDPILHNVHAYQSAEPEQSKFNIAQPVKGQRTIVGRENFTHAGIFMVTCDAGHPWMNAYVFVTPHRCYALTDKDGHFTLRDVPPGKYRLSVWHEGVAIAGAEMDGEKVRSYRYEPPYECQQEIVVHEGKETKSDFSFALRSQGIVSRAR
jgi:plastocyanin